MAEEVEEASAYSAGLSARFLELPDDIQDAILLRYRQGLQRRMINRSVARVLGQYRKGLDRRAEGCRFYTRRNLLVVFLNSMLSGYRTGDLAILGPRSRKFTRRAFRRW